MTIKKDLSDMSYIPIFTLQTAIKISENSYQAAGPKCQGFAVKVRVAKKV